MFISILGRQPKLSLAELEALFGADVIRPLSKSSALVDADVPNIDRLGGSIKIVDSVRELAANDLASALKQVPLYILNAIETGSTGKTTVGLSLYDDNSVSAMYIKDYMIKLKRELKSDGYSVRVVPNRTHELNSAQVLHNKLTRDRNMEIVLIKASGSYWIGRTSGVQDIEALARRDQERPKRDSKIGMLPPKLALLMLNLAGVQNLKDDPEEVVLDPFCGTGVVLQEALLLGLDVYGSDLNKKMIEYSRINLEWIKNKFRLPGSIKLELADAREHRWTTPVGAVVSETYLGPPLNQLPARDSFSTMHSDVNSLIRAFLKNIHQQLSPGTDLCLAVPAWAGGSKMLRLDLLDDLEKLGYTRRVFKHATEKDLIYHRPGQTVAREILVLERK